jgi:hypothetical protein
MIPSWSFAHFLILLGFIIEQINHLCTCPVLPDPLFRRGKDMKNKVIEELRPEYEVDYSKAVRGKYFKRLIEEGANVAVLEPEVAKVFTSSAAVNEALKSLLEITKSTQRLTKHSTGRAKKLRSG